MSTEWSYRCDTHQPPLCNTEPFYMSRTTLAIDLAKERRDAINVIPSFVMEHLEADYTRHWHWLRQHKFCTVTLVNDYGQTFAEWEQDKKR